MTLQVIEAETGPNPVATVIIMHGLGADGRDFLPIAEQLELDSIGPVRFLFPNAPVIPVTINGGYEMPAWYDIMTADLVRREDEAGLRASRLQVEALIAGETARGIPASSIVVAGFSQGCAMALMVGLRHAEALAGVIGMSGYLPLADLAAAERTAASLVTPIFLAHGTQDEVVALPRAVESRNALTSMGYSVDWHEYRMAHSVCPEEVLDVQAFLLRVLPKK